MTHNLRAKLSGLRYKGILEDKDYKRLCHALDLEKAEQEPTDDKCHYCEHNFTPYQGNTGDFTEQEPCEDEICPCEDETKECIENCFECEYSSFYKGKPSDLIRRTDMLDAVGHGTTYTTEHLQKIINGLPSVEPTQKSVENTLKTRCEDAVSRQAVLDLFEVYCGVAHNYAQVWEDVEHLPSVQPKAKTGRWIDRSEGGRIKYPWMEAHECDKCGECGSAAWNFCPNCGADMRGA